MPFIPDPLSPLDIKNVRIASLSKTANNAQHHEDMIAHHHSVAKSLDNLAQRYQINGDKDSYNNFTSKAMEHRNIADAHQEVRDYMNNVPKPDDNRDYVNSAGTYQRAECEQCNGKGVSRKNTQCGHCRGTGSKITFNNNPK